jgi:hypothetical protein
VAEFPAYAVLGSGRWAKRIQNILSGENRRVISLANTRPLYGESDSSFKQRLRTSLRISGAHCAWLCDVPGPYIPWTVESAIAAQLHVIVEKPWLYSPSETQSLEKQAQASGRIVSIHYEYCLLEAVEKWRRDFFPGTGLRFGGKFTIHRPGNPGIAAIDNFGSHLLAIRSYAVPESSVSEIRCGYKEPSERRVWLEENQGVCASIDFLRNREPIIQRFISKFEAALTGVPVLFDLDFAQRVTKELALLR